jgi:5'-methylthioinosine phosphorylase
MPLTTASRKMPTTKSEASPGLGIIGGSGLYLLEPGARSELHEVHTPFAAAPVQLSLEHTSAGPVWFLPRHGKDHSIAPHEINYRANLWALREAGVQRLVAVNAVGGISAAMQSGVLVLPDQLIDYSWGREHTYFAGSHSFDSHIDFTTPYSAHLSERLAQVAAQQGIALQQGGVYACTQGPRLETAAEIRRLARDGCDIVGMTGMPETALARELALDYACLALVVNRAAGLDTATIEMADIRRVMEAGIAKVRALLLAALPQLLQRT